MNNPSSSLQTIHATLFLITALCSNISADVWQETFHNPNIAKYYLEPLVKQKLLEREISIQKLADIETDIEIYTWLQKCNIDGYSNKNLPRTTKDSLCIKANPWS